jgi:hypothetical protein
MILEMMTMLFATTGSFYGKAVCEKLADGAKISLYMDVESNNSRAPAESISIAMDKVFEASTILGLKQTKISLQQSSEGRRRYQREQSPPGKEFFGKKTLIITTKDFVEVQKFLQLAAEAGFLMDGTPEYFLDNADSLTNHCIEKATSSALQRATAAVRALNGSNMTVSKISDDNDFHVFTSDDTRLDQEPVDKFFASGRSFYATRGIIPAPSKTQTFYKVAPIPLQASCAVKILVNFDTKAD